MKKVAIITRTKNRPVLLERAFESVRNQVYDDLVWVVVNDGGETESVDKIIEKAKKEGIDVKVVHNPTSLGMEAASNVGIKNCQSEYVIIHDDDDSWDVNFLKETVSYLEGELGKIFDGVVTHSIKVEECLEEDRCDIVGRTMFNDFLTEIYLTDIAKLNSFPPISFLYRREVYNKVGGYNESLPVLGDWDFNLKFLLHSNIGVIKKPLANYHHRINNVSVDYGNTVVQGIDKHRQYDMVLRNSLLREDIKNNKVGLGHLVNSERDIQNIIYQINGIDSLSELKRVIRQHGIRGVIRKLFKK